MRNSKAEIPNIFLDAAQLGERWHHHPESIRRKIRKGEIPAIVIGRRLLIPIEKIVEIETRSSLINPT